jgi:dethiobiotin synthetase
LIDHVSIPGLLFASPRAGDGKTTVACAVADWFARRGRRVAVLKPIDTGCPRRREGLVSEDAERLAHFGRSRHPLDLICPQRYHDELPPTIAAQRARRPVDWEAVNRSVRLISRDSDVMIVESVGGLGEPLDEKLTSLDLLKSLGLPVLLVVRSGASVIGDAAAAARLVQLFGAKVAGVAINRYASDGPSIVEEAATRQIERHAKSAVLCVVPEETAPSPTVLSPGIVSAVELVDWDRIVNERD